MRFCFYSGYRDQKGGYTTLLITLAKELHRQKHTVVIFNFKDGLIAGELKKENAAVTIIDLDTIQWNEIATLIFPTDVFVITKFEEIYRHLLTVNPKMVYYDINDFISSISEYKFGWKFSQLGKKLVQRLLDKNSILFMDDTGIFNLKNAFNINVENASYLPVPVNVPSENKYLTIKRGADVKLRVTYIGRSVDWKMMPLKKILQDCAADNIRQAVHFSIVVDDMAAFRKYIVPEDYTGSGMLIEVIENMLPSAINDFLLKAADIHFAMGTAALDAASLGIPTVLVDYSTKDFPGDYVYNWLFDTKHCSLGKNLEKIPAKKTGSSMEQVLLMDVGKRMQLSEKCYAYVKNNHAVNNLIPTLVKHCEKAGFRMKDAAGLVPFYFRAHTIVKKIAAIFRK